MRKIAATRFLTALAVALVACSGSSARMIQNHMEETRAGSPVKDVLIIVILDDQKIRAVFEKHFKDWLKVKGVDAITSVDVLPMDVKTKLEKEAIIRVVDKYENDAILITHLVGMEETEVFSRDRPRYFFNYYGFYNYGLAYVTWPTVYGEKVKFSLETALYDVKSESPIWAGESQLNNPKSTGQAIGQVVEMVMKALEKNGLLPKTI
ncbi:MAG: hypothetical protein V2I40_12160 [Desulfobacteraceae bacterium]|nr:hypothetical protein [Desulfobacteraceae bacterium]